MTAALLPSLYEKDSQFLRIAREVAMDLNDIETILKHYEISSNEWETIQRDPRFTKLLEAEVVAWNAAGNTHERTKLKAGALIEEWLLEANARIHDPKELLSAKTEVVKLLARIAEMGGERGGAAGGAGVERFSVTINMGADKNLTFVKTITPQVIDATATAVTIVEARGVDDDEADPSDDAVEEA